VFLLLQLVLLLLLRQLTFEQLLRQLLLDGVKLVLLPLRQFLLQLI
jgi:hypothetical protein